MTRVLVCGGRDYQDRERLFVVLDEHHARQPITVLIEGGADGADRFASMWAFEHEIDSDTFFAKWKVHGRAAGPIRNQRMIDEGRPDVVIAFPGGRGTADMMKRARAAGVEVIEVRP